MAGRGPAPKPAGRRARRNTDPNPVTTIEFIQGEQPSLPEGNWHPMTEAWWRTWGESPQAEHFMAVDWSFLLDTAVFHHAVWTAKDEGRSATEAGKELRTRVQDFGSTVASRLRLRMQFAEVDASDEKRGLSQSGARAQYGPLRAV